MCLHHNNKFSHSNRQIEAVLSALRMNEFQLEYLLGKYDDVTYTQPPVALQCSKLHFHMVWVVLQVVTAAVLPLEQLLQFAVCCIVLWFGFTNVACRHGQAVQTVQGHMVQTCLPSGS